MVGREGLLVCELSSSAVVTLNFTPNHTWLSGFPLILSGLFGISGKEGLGLLLFSFLLNSLLCPYPTPAPVSFLPFTLGPELGGWGWWVGDKIRNLSSKVPTKFHETRLHPTILLLSELKKRGNYKVSSLKIRPESSSGSPSHSSPPAHAKRPDWP